MVDFSKFTNEQLWEIYQSARVFEWNKLLGEKPDGFDNLRKFRFCFLDRIFHRRTKEDYTHPIYCLVQELIPDDFFQKKEEEHRKAQMDALWEWNKLHILSEKSLKKHFGKELFEHMSKQPE